MAYDENENYIDESEEALGNVARWVPYTVVCTALAGFILLAWYAYQAGTQSVSEEDLLVVEADDSPVKEKPEDPGGMQFPNQDKMIFETFSSQSGEPPKVERLMPAPEEPVVVTSADQETTTWVNEKLQDKQPAAGQTASREAKEQFVKEAALDKESSTAQHTSDEVNSFRKEEAKLAKATEPAPVAAKTRGNAQVQLGAYGSEKEAQAAWKKISDKQGSLLKGHNHAVVKADLGAKGIFYRLRVTGISSMDAARILCKELSAKGQACMAVSG